MTVGIERIRQVLVDSEGNTHFGMHGKGSVRFEKAERRWPAANQIYRTVFKMLESDLADGETISNVDKTSYIASFDGEFGIDIILHTKTGRRMTLQEKLLEYPYQFVTVEFMNDFEKNVQGDWFKIGCQYYFVGYHDTGSVNLHSWILLDWTETMRATERREIVWAINRNKRDGARSNFKYAPFKVFPERCVLGVQYRGEDPTIHTSVWQTPQLILLK